MFVLKQLLRKIPVYANRFKKIYSNARQLAENENMVVEFANTIDRDEGLIMRHLVWICTAAGCRL